VKYWLSVFLGACSYGILSTIVVLAYGKGYSLGEVVGSQLLIGFALSWLYVLYARRREAKKQRKNDRSAERPYTRLNGKQRLVLLGAGIPTGVTGLLYYESLHYIEASLAILLLFQFTWIGVVTQAIIERKRPQNTMLLTILVLLGGTVLAAGLTEEGFGKFNWIGVAFGLLAALSYSLFILLSGKAVPSAHPAERSAWMVTGALALTFILFPPHFLFDGGLRSDLMLYGLLLGLFGAFIPPILYAIGVPRIGEGMTGILGAAELPVAVLSSSIVLRELVSPLQWFGVALVLIGIALPELLNLRRRARTVS
jgi:drug/metabolite transporter (DMT)-like permease